MKNLPNQVKGYNNDKGAQLEYKLLPLSAIEKVILEIESPRDLSCQSIDDAIISECEHTIEELLLAKQKFNDLYQRVKDNAHVLHRQVLIDFNEKKKKTAADETRCRKGLSETIVQVDFKVEFRTVINTFVLTLTFLLETNTGTF